MTGMEFLISTGTSAAYFYSLLFLMYALTVTHHSHNDDYTYFETAAMLITVVLLGM